MDTSVTYEKVYFEDNYKQQLEELRSRYHARTQRALGNIPAESKPLPNIAEIIYLHDNDDGGVTVTTGDFIEYFNHRYGDNDRIGAMRRSLAVAEKESDVQGEPEVRRHREENAEEHTGFADRVRSAGRRLALVNAVFVLVLMLSIAVLVVSSVVFDDVNNDLSALEVRATNAASTEEHDGNVNFFENTANVDLPGHRP